jgi:small subunit ribosomal protein S1
MSESQNSATTIIEEEPQLPLEVNSDGNLDEGMESVSFADLLDEYAFNVPQRGDLLSGEVLSIFDNAILVDVGAKRDAVVPASDLSSFEGDWRKDVAIGDTLPVYVTQTPYGDDDLVVSLKRGLEAQDWVTAVEDMEAGTLLQLPIVGLNRGGVLVSYRRLRGFVPNSHISTLRFVRNDEERDRLKQGLMGAVLPLKIIEVDSQRRRMVMSALEAEKEQRKARMAELEEGAIVTGRVENLTDFGAFVDIGGVSGLIHVSKLDWRRVNHPSQVLKAGDEVEVLIEKVDPERERISLNRQAVLPNPWELAAKEYQEGDEIEGVVTNVVDFGAFVRVPAGVEGLVHLSEMPTFVTDNPAEIVQRGEEVKVRVLSIDPRRERLALSMMPLEPVAEIDWEIAEGDALTEQAIEEQAVESQTEDADSSEPVGDAA